MDDGVPRKIVGHTFCLKDNRGLQNSIENRENNNIKEEYCARCYKVFTIVNFILGPH
jgi:hypothetical protein